ncbi:hypothetical protein D3C79_896140 [compost metagenome]
MIHLVGGARHLDFHDVFIGVINQAAAVETGSWRGAAPAIRFAHLIHQLGHGGLLGVLIALFVRRAEFQWLIVTHQFGGGHTGFPMAAIAFFVALFRWGYFDFGYFLG